MSRYTAHKTDDGREQSVKEHLENVASLCAENSIDELKDCARLCGLLHDLGKFTDSFQKHINGSPVRVEHARYGAQELAKHKAALYTPMLEYCIAGHHTGLPDGGNRTDREDTATLHGILKRETEDYSAFKNEISVNYPTDTLDKIILSDDPTEVIERYAFLTRYIFSCLTDADFLDTEHFCSPDTERRIHGDFDAAYRLVCDRLNSFSADTKLQKSRQELQEQVYNNVDENGDVYIIDMPTGSGKTLCSIRAALQKVIAGKKKRIIYVIPYVSIIEQTAEIFENIFGSVLPVIQHHSNYDFDNENINDEGLAADKLKRSCENWDAPLIVTTNIQFFESLYHHKSSRLRKMHNLAESVIVFDEIHMLPVDYIQPCLRAVGYITRYLHSTAMIMSATMPDYSELSQKYMKQNTVLYAIRDKACYDAFRKCRYIFISECSLEFIVEKASVPENALVIVNKRKTAKELYKLCKSVYDGNVYHLSTYMIPAHRSEVISRIRNDLASGVRTIVISTSLIEAGVDLDFRVVFRENAGIDNIIQSGGRCNREGKYELGDVFVFETDGGHGDIQLKSNITRKLFDEFEDISSEECVKEYYKRLFAINADAIEKNSILSLMGGKPRFDEIPFRTYSEGFGFINTETIGILIPDDNNRQLICELRYGKLSVKRRLQKYCASVYCYEFELLLKSGVIEQLTGGVYMLTNTDYYDSELGLNIEQETDYFL